MQSEARLNKPELLSAFSFGFNRLVSRYMLRSARLAAQDREYQPNLAIVVRTRNDRQGLGKIIEYVEKERRYYKGRIDLIVVDTESTDGTDQLAKAAGAKLVRISQQEFNYPKGINLGLAAAKPDVVAAFITVGHAEPALSNCLAAGARHFADPRVAGVYSDYLPNSNASFWEKFYYFFAVSIFFRMRAGAHSITKIHKGAMQGVCCFVRLSIWRKHQFDEAYGHGGEDMEWARQAIQGGHILIYDPAVTAYHSHGLGFINLHRQVLHWWRISRRPGQFDVEKIHGHRPDLR